MCKLTPIVFIRADPRHPRVTSCYAQETDRYDTESGAVLQPDGAARLATKRADVNILHAARTWFHRVSGAGLRETSMSVSETWPVDPCARISRRFTLRGFAELKPRPYTFDACRVTRPG